MQVLIYTAPLQTRQMRSIPDCTQDRDRMNAFNRLRNRVIPMSIDSHAEGVIVISIQ